MVGFRNIPARDAQSGQAMLPDTCSPPPSATEEERLSWVLKYSSVAPAKTGARGSKDVNKTPEVIKCYSCGQLGHWRSACPRRTVRGIPRRQIKYVSSDTPSAMMLLDGRYAVVQTPM